MQRFIGILLALFVPAIVTAAITYTQYGAHKEPRPTMCDDCSEVYKTAGPTWQSIKRENWFLTASATIGVNGQKIGNLADPVSAQQAATKNYVDSLVASSVTSEIGIKGHRIYKISGNNAVIGPLYKIMFDTGSGLQTLTQTSPKTIDLTTTSADCPTCTIDVTLLAAQYYFYAYDSAGTIKYEVSTTGPDLTRIYKTSDTTRIYIGSVFNADVGAMSGYLVEHSCIDGSCQVALQRKVEVVYAASTACQQIGSWAPPHASMVEIIVQTGAGCAVSQGVTIYNDGFCTSAKSGKCTAATPGNLLSMQHCWMVGDDGMTTGKIVYGQSSTNLCNFSASTNGYKE